jgi:hypothetical protein
VRDAEGGEAGTASPSVVIVIASPFLKRAKQSLIRGVVLLGLLHFIRNDDKARIAEAIAKPVAARPEPTTAVRYCED